MLSVSTRTTELDASAPPAKRISSGFRVPTVKTFNHATLHFINLVEKSI